MVVAQGQDGIIAHKIIDGAMNGDRFRAWINELVESQRPGDIVVRDNLAAHKVSGAREVLPGAVYGASRLPAAVHPGLQSHRTGEFTDEVLSPENRCENKAKSGCRDQGGDESGEGITCAELCQELRVCGSLNLIGYCSEAGSVHVATIQ